MEEVVLKYPLTIGEEMERDHKNDPFWRKTFTLKYIDRWEDLILNSEVRLDLHQMVMKALEHDLLMWPIGRLCLAHVHGCDDVELESSFSSKSVLEPTLLLKILRFILTEPELTTFIRKEEGRPLVASWFDKNFAWIDTDGNQVKLSEFIVKFSDFCLNNFFEQNHENGYTTVQLCVFTQMRSHDVLNCTKVIPFSGISAIQKPSHFREWPNPDGFTYQRDQLVMAVKQIREHFEMEANRPSIPPMTFNLN